MASGKYGVRPPGWAQHKRNLDRPFWSKMRTEEKRLIRREAQQEDVLQEEDEVELMHAAKESKALPGLTGPLRKTWCGVFAPLGRTSSDPRDSSRITCTECQNALKAAGVYFLGGL